jgi:hypothetical protein
MGGAPVEVVGAGEIGGLEFLDGGAEKFVQAAKGWCVDGYADGTDGDMQRAAATFGDTSEIILHG